MSKPKKRRNHLPPRVLPPGWSTSDTDEIERRRMRGVNEAIRVEPQTPDDEFFGIYRIISDSGRKYRVEIRSLAEPINSCDCPDHRINGLGTCKHIEALLVRLQHRRKRAYRAAAANGSAYFEIFLDRRDQQIRIIWPSASGRERRSRPRDILLPFFTDSNRLRGEPLDGLPALERAINAAHAAVKRRIRISNELNAWLGMLDRRAQQLRSRQHFEAEVSAVKASVSAVTNSRPPRNSGQR
jgi:hypothetical protein